MDSIKLPEVEVMDAVISEVVSSCLSNHGDSDESHEECEMCKFNKFLNSLGDREKEPPSDLDKCMYSILGDAPGAGIFTMLGGMRDVVYIWRLAFWMGYRTAISTQRNETLQDLMKD